MPTEPNPALESASNQTVEGLLKLLLDRREEVLTELERIDALLACYHNEPSKAESNAMPQPLALLPKTRPQRVRGVLAAARKAIDEMTGPFDKNDLLKKLIEIDGDLAHKKVTGANIRNALRLLTLDGVIKVKTEATATTRATYVKAS